MTDMIELDGATGGGQLLRTALSLSLCTGIGFTMQHIRAKRSRPGLMRQHLTAVNAAARIGNACTHGAQLGATTLRFEPGVVVPGEYAFATGSAGSAILVLQTVLPPLWRCEAPSRLRLEGGTHNPLAPSADFITDTYLPALTKIGIDASIVLERPGFFPAGGGILHATVSPASTLRHADFVERGELVSIDVVAMLSGLAASIGERELQTLAKRLQLKSDALHLHEVRPSIGPGNALLVRVRHAHHPQLASRRLPVAVTLLVLRLRRRLRTHPAAERQDPPHSDAALPRVVHHPFRRFLGIQRYAVRFRAGARRSQRCGSRHVWTFRGAFHPCRVRT